MKKQDNMIRLIVKLLKHNADAEITFEYNNIEQDFQIECILKNIDEKKVRMIIAD